MARRSPRANGKAMAAASSEQVKANPPTVALPPPPQKEYAAPPNPMPRSAMARMSPKVNVDPPSSGASMRYQTSSMSRKTKPVRAAAARTSGGGEAAYSRTSRPDPSLTLGMTARLRATMPTSALSSTATYSVRRLPNTSSMKNVESSVPITAPRVFTP